MERETSKLPFLAKKWGCKCKIGQNGCMGANRSPCTLIHDPNRLWAWFESKTMATFWENGVYVKLGFSKFTKTTPWP